MLEDFQHINNVAFNNELTKEILLLKGNSKKFFGAIYAPVIPEDFGITRDSIGFYPLAAIELSRFHNTSGRIAFCTMAHEMIHLKQCQLGRKINHGKWFRKECRRIAKLLNVLPMEII